MAEELSFKGDGSDAYGGKLRLPPQNIEAEEAILGGILLDPEAISRVSDRLLSEAFYISAHKDIYQAAVRLHAQGKPTDLLSVTSWLTDHDLLVRIGGRNKLATLVDGRSYSVSREHRRLSRVGNGKIPAATIN